MSKEPTGTGRDRQKQRTRRQILAAAAALIAAGMQPTITDAADAASVSRRTAYRYFPSQEKLLTEAALEGTRPAMEAAMAAAPQGSSSSDLEERVVALVTAVQKGTLHNESLLRTMVHTTVLEKPQGTPRRGTRRIDWVESAVAPLRPQVSRALYERLVSALTLCVGIEAVLVLRDMRGLSGAQATAVSEWMARTLLHATLEDAGLGRGGGRPGPAKSRRARRAPPADVARRRR